MLKIDRNWIFNGLVYGCVHVLDSLKLKMEIMEKEEENRNSKFVERLLFSFIFYNDKNNKNANSIDLKLLYRRLKEIKFIQNIYNYNAF